MEIQDFAFLQFHAVDDIGVIAGLVCLAQKGDALNGKLRESIVQSMSLRCVSGGLYPGPDGFGDDLAVSIVSGKPTFPMGLSRPAHLDIPRVTPRVWCDGHHPVSFGLGQGRLYLSGNGLPGRVRKFLCHHCNRHLARLHFRNLNRPLSMHTTCLSRNWASCGVSGAQTLKKVCRYKTRNTWCQVTITGT